MIKQNLIANINALDEKTGRSDEEAERDDYSPSQIDYSDLLFTLKEKKGGYIRPLVKKEKGGLYVVTNQLFFRAVKEAGIGEIKFDLWIDSSNPQKIKEIMDSYHLRESEPVIPTYCIDRLLFFQSPLKRLIQKEGIEINPRTYSKDYSDRNCARYGLSTKKGLLKTLRTQHDFLEEMADINGLLRSIDGIKKLTYASKEYFKQVR